MRKRNKRIYLILYAGLTLLVVAAIGYAGWNSADPKHTCAQCHEVAPAHEKWLSSAHAKIQCTECHGTALSNGFHSLKEKAGMVVTHVFDNKRNDDIRLTEEQILDIADRCATCHQSEYAGWLAGGHAVNYKEIFMDSVHNVSEKPYWDCLRCHGMFYDGNIHDLMSLDGEPHEWKINDRHQETRPAVPCLACHRMHTENPVSERPIAAVGQSSINNPKTALYVRADKIHLRSDKLTKVSMMSEGKAVDSASDPNTLLCQQCHAPDYLHRAGSEDDRTPVGVHEGISCIACHKPHSGSTRESCAKCHPSLTDEQVKQICDNPHRFAKERCISQNEILFSREQ
jgi:hypothetical protein